MSPSTPRCAHWSKTIGGAHRGACWWAWVFIHWITCLSQCTAETPQVKTVSTRWLRVDTEVPVQFDGHGLESGRSLWTSFPATVSRPTGLASASKHWSLRVQSENGEGCGVVRWVGTNGISDPLLMAWDKLPTLDLAPGEDRSRATVLSNEGRVRGVFRAGATDWFRIPAAASHLVFVEIISARLGSKADPYLEVWSAGGQRVFFQEDAPGLGADVRVRLDELPPGDKWIAVRDSGFGGGSDMEYWLRASPRPWNGLAHFEFRTGSGEGKREQTLVEREPNDRLDQAGLVTFDASTAALMRGVLEKPRDQDLYRIRVPKAGKYVAYGFGRSLGSAALVRLKWLDGQGKWLGVSSPNGPDEALVEIPAQPDADYFLAIDDWTGSGGSNFQYEFRVEPSLGVRGVTDGITKTVKPGGTFEIKVNWTFPKDAKGNFRLGIEAENWAVEPSEIPAGQKETTLRITVPKGLMPGMIRHFRLGLAGDSAGSGVRWCVGTRSGLRRIWPDWVFPSPVMDGWIGVGVTD